ncbi:MAG: hypothetical protein KIS88_03820 [Anaerolineales bacterium]|nr:hypothetical protein [Anaerolineales bacterium]
MFKDHRNLLGVLLILFGVYLVLEQFGIIPASARGLVPAALFIIAAISLFSMFFANPSRWWAAMVGFFLSGLAISALVGVFAPDMSERIGGPIFLGALSLGFASVFLINRELWWAIIPSGVTLSLAAVSYFESTPEQLPFEPAGVLFIGLGLTFLLLSTVKAQGQQLAWAIYPAIPLLVFGTMLALGTEQSWSVMGPLLLIAGGVWLLYSSLRKRN